MATTSQQLPLDLPSLGTYERVPIIGAATDAGFLPTTHLEKNNALAVLAFSDTKQHPGGLHDHLMEIFDHQEKQYKTDGKSVAQSKLLAGISVRSVIFTYGDHLANARSSYVRLTGLLKAIREVDNPTRNLGSVLEDELSGRAVSLNALVRYIDLRSLAERKKGNKAFQDFDVGYDPLRTIEEREAQSNGANKRIVDVYTGSVVPEVVAERIKLVAGSTSIVSARKLTQEAIDDQIARGRFFARTLKGVKGQFKNHASEVEATAYAQHDAA
jgi:hypothetical protein